MALAKEDRAHHLGYQKALLHSSQLVLPATVTVVVVTAVVAVVVVVVVVVTAVVGPEGRLFLCVCP